jgi:hypothetical protein
MKEAWELNLIPSSFSGADFRQPVNRAEFAAISVKLYEKLSGAAAEVPSANPFTDTSDPEVLKAYGAGITAGIGGTLFSPDELLDREQAATMLARVYKAAVIPGWTLADDPEFPLAYEMPAPFADDAAISDWARDSVYFMASHGVIAGIGLNTFAPKNTTSAETASGYANATREQALAISLRVVNKLGAAATEPDTAVSPTQSSQPSQNSPKDGSSKTAPQNGESVSPGQSGQQGQTGLPATTEELPTEPAEYTSEPMTNEYGVEFFET